MNVTELHASIYALNGEQNERNESVILAGAGTRRDAGVRSLITICALCPGKLFQPMANAIYYLIQWCRC
jgi:hypothetical protein